MEQNLQQTPNEQPLITIKPKFIFSLFVLTLIPKEIFLTIWSTLFFGGFGLFGILFLNAGLHLSLPLWLPALVILLFVLLGLPIVSYILSSKNYKNTEYRFYKDRLEYMDGFINVQMKSIEYRNITSVTFRKGFFQRMYNVGSILIITSSIGFIPTAGLSIPSLAGVIVLLNIDQPENIYNNIQTIISPSGDFQANPQSASSVIT